MAVMDEEVGVQGRGRQVVDAARAVGNVAENEAVGDGGECFENI